MKINVIICAFLLCLNANPASVYAAGCDSQEVEKFLSALAYPGYKTAYDFLKKIPVETFTGTMAPTWYDFNNTELALKALKEQNAAFPKSAASEVLKKAKEILPKDASYAARQLATTTIVLEPQQVENLDLKLLFFDMIHDLNRHLPKFARIELKGKSKSQRHSEFILEAKVIVKNLEVETRKRFFEKTNFQTTENVTKAIRANSFANEKLIDIVVNEQAEFTMLRPSKGRWWIQRLGFQNQRVTGSSNGTLSREDRDSAEAGQALLSQKEYIQKSAELKPKYGYLRPPIESELQVVYPSTYGDDLYIFDKEKLKGRVTWTYTDSLAGRKSEMRWDYLMTPWSERELLLPYLERNFRTGKFHPGAPTLHDFSTYPHHHYVELQYWGPVDLSYVKKFVYMKAPPDGEFESALKSFGIEIIDGRQGHISKQNVPYF